MVIKIEVQGYITPDGRVEFDLPKELPSGKFDLIVHVAEYERAAGLSNNGAEIAQSPEIGSWHDVAIEGESTEWVKEQRRKRNERYEW